MKQLYVLFVICVMMIVIVSACMAPTLPQELKDVMNIGDLVRLFPTSAELIESQTKSYIRAVKKQVKRILEIPEEDRTFDNTAKALDNVLALSDLAIFAQSVQLMDLLSPVEKIREKAREASVKIDAVFIELFSDKKLYHAFKAYVEGPAKKESLTDDQLYFLDHMMKEFKRNGLELSDEALEIVKSVQKELTVLTIEFDKNIAADNRFIIITRSELEGLSDEFIDSLKKSDDGKYIVGVDYPTYFAVMQQAVQSETRKKLYLAFNNRGYPENDLALQQIIAKRDQLAKLLGFESYAHFDLDDQMVKTPERARAFIENLIERATQKETDEFNALIAQLPAGVALVDGKLQPWDYAYVQDLFKKKCYNLDEEKISEYFPVEETLKGLLGIYESFLSLHFKEEFSVRGLWSNDVRLLKVCDKTEKNVLGYLLLDLYPRAHKYSHAAHSTIVPATYDKDGNANNEVSVIMANFPKARGGKPALFKRDDVRTFFHEFGHAMHALLGRTRIAAFSGTKVKRDFVEMPSQMLEEWLSDREILKLVSSHYQTGQSLPDDIIDNMLAAKHIATGAFVQRQSFLSLLALDYFLQGEQKDLNEITKKLHHKIMKHVAYVPEAHAYASFGHLSGYGAKYYGYLWSRVFGLDLFNEIKKHGLLNPDIGSKYIQDVIGRGGSADPNSLLRNFLSREPTDAAFFKDMGLE